MTNFQEKTALRATARGATIYFELLKDLKKSNKSFDIFKAEEKIEGRLIKEILKKKKAKLKKNLPNYSDYALVKIKKKILETIQKKYNVLVSLEIPPIETLADIALPCFKLAKQLKKNPNELAKEMSDFLSEKLGSEFSNIKPSGGYVNLTFFKEKLADAILKEIAKFGNNYGASNEGKNKNIVLDYSSPNIAKPMSVGHLRSTIIGDSIKNIYEYSGFSTVKINYLGDWGTQFGKLLYMLLSAAKNYSIKNFLNLYVNFHKQAEKNPKLNEKAKELFKKLEKGEDLELVKKWLEIADASLKEFQKIYERLGVKFDLAIGESFYKKKAEALIKKCLTKKIAQTEKGGPVVVDLSKHGLRSFLLRKSDEATLYAARDLAAAEFRYKNFKPFKIIYVVGNEQTFYFRQIFKTLELLKIGKHENFLHLGFGLVSLPEGKISTRAGRVIFLEDLLNEAVKRAEEVVESKNPNLTPKEKRDISEAVGIGAVIYSDLSQDREKNIVFSWDKALNLKGDSAPYIQYGYARIMSIIKKFQITNSKLQKNSKLQIPNSEKLTREENKIISLLARFPDAVAEARRFNRPDMIANYLNDLTREFNRFYENVPVLSAAGDSRDFRLTLINSIGQIIKNGLNLLGIKTLDKM